MTVSYALAWFLLLLLLVAYVGIVIAVAELASWWAQMRRTKAERIEAELDRAQAQLRATILTLASELGADAHEARKALIRESFLASGRMPEP